jgi:menaquinone-dependent protoporphyrinogen oxidase
MRAAIFFATREGQTRRVADRLAADLRARQVEVDVSDLRELHTPVDWSRYSTACVAASVHIGHHEPEAIAFARRYRAELEALGAAFLSVTLSEAGAEDRQAPKDQRLHAAGDVQHLIDVFVQETGWRPAHVLPVAGALAYKRYNVFVRFVMKRIARKANAPTDASRDYEFTDWDAVDRFADRLIAGPADRPSAPPPRL